MPLTTKQKEYRAGVASDNQKAVLTKYGIKFEEDITVAEFESLVKEHRLNMKPSEAQMDLIKDFILKTKKTVGQKKAKKIIDKYGMNAWTVSVAIDYMRPFVKTHESTDFSNELDITFD